MIILTRSEIARLMPKIRLPQHRLMVALAYAAGLRTKEVVNLRVKDLNLDTKTIQSKGRTIPLPDKLQTKLWLLTKDKIPEAFLFAREHGIPFSIRNVQIMFRRALKRARLLKPATFKSLRDSFGMHLLENGISTERVQKLLGHKNIKITRRRYKVTNQNNFAIAGLTGQIPWADDYRPGRF